MYILAKSNVIHTLVLLYDLCDVYIECRFAM